MAVWPRNFTVQGRLTAGGVAFHPQNQVSDCDVRVSDDSLKYELLAVSNRGSGTGAQVFYSEASVAGSIVTGWSDPRSGNYPESVIAPLPSTDNREGVDTPATAVHPNLSSGGSLLCFTEARPGERDVYARQQGFTGEQLGRASVIKVQTDHQRKAGASRVWCQDPGRIILRGRQAWNKPFRYQNQQGVWLWSGGVLEPSVIWDSTLGPNGGFILFFLGLNEKTPGGSWEARIGRAEVIGLSEGTLNPLEPVWSPPASWTRREGFMPHTVLDPDGSTIHMVLIGNGGHVYNYRSSDKGFTWAANEANPILRVTAAGLPENGEAFLAGPRLMLNPAGTTWNLFFDYRYSKPGQGAIGGPDGGLYVATATV